MNSSQNFPPHSRKDVALSGHDWSHPHLRGSDYDQDTMSRPTSGYDSDIWVYGECIFAYIRDFQSEIRVLTYMRKV